MKNKGRNIDSSLDNCYSNHITVPDRSYEVTEVMN